MNSFFPWLKNPLTMSLEESFQAQVEDVSFSLGLSSEEGRFCLDPENQDSEACRESWENIADRLSGLIPEMQQRIALELDPASVAKLCQVSLALRYICEDEVFWKRKWKKDVGISEKLDSDLSWKENYPLGVEEKKKQLLETLTFLELGILVENFSTEEVYKVPRTSQRIQILQERFSLGRFYTLFESMRTLSFPTPTRILKVKLPEDLRHLNLAGFHITELPYDLFLFSSLQKLFLWDNDLSFLPSEIGNLHNLQWLNLDDNQISALPPEIGNLSSLKKLYLKNNGLTTLPSEIGHLASLKKLFLDQNLLTELPPEIGDLRNLQVLFIRANQLSSLPPEIGRLENLIVFEVNNNQLSTFPPEIGFLSSLKELYAIGNQLTTLPSEMGALSRLELLRLRNNQLTTLPSEMGALSRLEILDLRNNPIQEIPSEITSKVKDLKI